MKNFTRVFLFCSFLGITIPCIVTPLIQPEPWGCAEAPHMGGGDIYSPEPIKRGRTTWLYFGGWVEQCRTHDAIYVAIIRRNRIRSIQAVIKPEDVGFFALNDPAIVKLYDPTTRRDYLLMYMTGVAIDTGQITHNKIYISFSWADDGINWSPPALLLDGFWNPGAAVNPETGHVWLWATQTTFRDGQWNLTAFDMGPTGTVEHSRMLVMPADVHNTNVSARWIVNEGWRILTNRWEGDLNTNVIDEWRSSDGWQWEMVRPRLIVPEAGYQAITPAWGFRSEIYYGHYRTGWPPDSSIWIAR